MYRRVQRCQRYSGHRQSNPDNASGDSKPLRSSLAARAARAYRPGFISRMRMSYNSCNRDCEYMRTTFPLYVSRP